LRNGHRVDLRESAGIALGAIRANQMRSFLTLLGTIIGVASVITVLSFVEGLNHFISDKLLNQGANAFSVDKYGFITSQEEFEDAQGRPDVTISDADALRSGVEHASAVVAQAGGQVVAKARNKDVRSVNLKGRSPGYD